MATAFPKTQYAVQLTGPGRLRLNPAKAVLPPGPHEIMIKIEACGLCFSDLKLLRQFSAHPRKTAVRAGLPPQVLAEIQGYVPDEKPTVPGHEVVGRIVAIGDAVARHHVGERVLVQADWRDLSTSGSNGAFGYNFEGGLQEYTVLDERVVIDAKGQRYLIPAGENRSASAVALVEPWACVEDSYVTRERRTIRPGGRLLIVAAQALPPAKLPELPWDPAGRPQEILSIASADAASLANECFDDIVYFGADKTILDILNDKLAARGIINIVLGGGRIGKPVAVGVGRVHYGMTRWIGTPGHHAAESYHNIPTTGELRPGDKLCIVGAAGPMGQMHVLRSLSCGLPGLEVTAADMDDARLASLARKASPLAQSHGIKLRLVNSAQTKLDAKFSYHALMAPLGPLVAEAILQSAPANAPAIINIFAGIAAPVKQDLDLDAYIANRCFMFGTSGSEIEDMRIVLRKIESGQLNTNASIDAISGIAGAIAGIAATEQRTLAGKIIVYPMLHDLGLTPLTELPARFPTVAARLQDGQWTKEAEAELLRVAGPPARESTA